MSSFMSFFRYYLYVYYSDDVKERQTKVPFELKHTFCHVTTVNTD